MRESFISSNSEKIGRILSDDTAKSVPRFQRGFSWEKEQIEQLWADLTDTIQENRNEYFLGSMIFNKKSRNTIEIIDGQQRLATLTIILAAIRDIFWEMSDERHNDIQSRYIATKDIKTRRFYGRLGLNWHDEDFFKKYVVQDYQNIDQEEEYKKERRLWSTNKLIFSAYKFFKGKINEELSKFSSQKEKVNFLLALTECITDRLVVITTFVGSDIDAYLVFETLNDRGIELSIADLLKNYLFSKAGKDLNAVQAAWEEISNTLSSVNINVFLRHYWISSREFVREKNLYAEIKKYIKQDVVDLVSKLKEEAGVYASLVDPDDEYWKDPKLTQLLNELNILGIKQCFPLLLSGRKKLSSRDFKKLVRAAVNLSVRYSAICNFNPNQLERHYSSIARNIRNLAEIDMEGLLKDLKRLCPDNGTFKEAFMQKDIKSKKVARYILEKINEKLMVDDGNVELKTKGPQEVNLEHILPLSLNSEWEEYLKFKGLDYTEWVNKIGNMTLLGAEYNKRASNKFFTHKQDEMYKKSKLPVTKSLIDFDEWDDKTILERQKEFSEIASNIWRV